MAYSLYVSFFDYSVMRGTFRFIGLNNYIEFLTEPFIVTVLTATVYFSVASISCIMLLGLFTALVLNEQFKGRGIARALLLIPWALPGIVSGIMWKWIYNGKYGVLNYGLKSLGIIDQYQSFVTSEIWAMPLAILANVWKQFPWTALLLLAGLQVIPHDLYEQSTVDGANLLQRFRFVTLPLLRGPMMLALIFETIWTLRAFDVIFALTGGGPSGTTTVIGWWAYTQAFVAWDFGRGSAISWIIAVVTIIIAYVYYKVLYKRVYY